MKRFREVVQSMDAPEDRNVLWLDISNSEQPLLKFYFINDWVALAGGGGPSPTPSKLKYYYYYGSLNTRKDINTIDVLELNSTKNSSTTGNFDKVYYYIAISEDQSIVSVVTANQENITSQFNNIGTFVVGDVQYKLYEFFLDTLIPLDITATINITGNTK